MITWGCWMIANGCLMFQRIRWMITWGACTPTRTHSWGTCTPTAARLGHLHSNSSAIRFLVGIGNIGCTNQRRKGHAFDFARKHDKVRAIFQQPQQIAPTVYPVDRRWVVLVPGETILQTAMLYLLDTVTNCKGNQHSSCVSRRARNHQRFEF